MPNIENLFREWAAAVWGDTTLSQDASAGDTELHVDEDLGILSDSTIRVGVEAEAEVQSVDRINDTITLKSGLSHDVPKGDRVARVPVVKKNEEGPPPANPFARLNVTRDQSVGQGWSDVSDAPKGSGFEKTLKKNFVYTIEVAIFGEQADSLSKEMDVAQQNVALRAKAWDVGIGVHQIDRGGSADAWLSTESEQRAQLTVRGGYGIRVLSPYPAQVIEKVEAKGTIDDVEVITIEQE